MKNVLKIREFTAACLIILITALTGCGNKAVAPESFVDLAKDGTIKAVMTSDFDKDYYDTDELTEGIAMAVDEYNKKAGGWQIELKEVRSEGSRAEVTMNYRTAADYASFNNVTFFSGPVKEGLEADILPEDISLYPVGTGEGEMTPVTPGALEGDERFLVFMEPLSVKVPGKVLYLSEGLTLGEDGRITADESLYNGPTLTTLVYVIFDS